MSSTVDWQGRCKSLWHYLAEFIHIILVSHQNTTSIFNEYSACSRICAIASSPTGNFWSWLVTNTRDLWISWFSLEQAKSCFPNTLPLWLGKPVAVDQVYFSEVPPRPQQLPLIPAHSPHTLGCQAKSHLKLREWLPPQSLPEIHCIRKFFCWMYECSYGLLRNCWMWLLWVFQYLEYDRVQQEPLSFHLDPQSFPKFNSTLVYSHQCLVAVYLSYSHPTVVPLQYHIWSASLTLATWCSLWS